MSDPVPAAIWISPRHLQRLPVSSCDRQAHHSMQFSLQQVVSLYPLLPEHSQWHQLLCPQHLVASSVLHFPSKLATTHVHWSVPLVALPHQSCELQPDLLDPRSQLPSLLWQLHPQLPLQHASTDLIDLPSYPVLLSTCRNFPWPAVPSA